MSHHISKSKRRNNFLPSGSGSASGCSMRIQDTDPRYDQCWSTSLLFIVFRAQVTHWEVSPPGTLAEQTAPAASSGEGGGGGGGGWSCQTCQVTAHQKGNMSRFVFVYNTVLLLLDNRSRKLFITNNLSQKVHFFLTFIHKRGWYLWSTVWMNRILICRTSCLARFTEYPVIRQATSYINAAF